MNVSFLRQLTLSSALALSLTGFAAAANAATVYTVQLGSFESEKEARDHWEKLGKRFPELFSPLQYASAKVQLPPDDFMYFRTQAGPLSSRSEADDICKNLIVKGFECYVAETAMFMADGKNIAEEEASEQPVDDTPPPPPPAPVASSEPAAQKVDLMEAEEIKGMYASTEPAKVPPAPEKTVIVGADKRTVSAAPMPAAASVPSPATTPWKDVSDAASAPAAPPAGGRPFEVGQSSYANGTAGVAQAPAVTMTATPAAVAVNGGEMADLKVAEAVPVPLDSVNTASTGYSSGPPAQALGLPSQQFRRPTLWAEISYFTTQDAALGYWRTLRSRDNTIPQGLRLRVVKPLRQRGGDERLSLRVGPFDNTNAIRRLCSFTSQEKLRCQAMRDIGSTVSYAQGQRQRLDPAEAYARRQGAATPFSAPSGSGMHWIQLGAYPTLGAAQQQWGALKAAHGYALSKVREDIAAPGYSSTARPVYRLRAGPFASSMDAMNTCSTLKRNGAMCMVVPGR